MFTFDDSQANNLKPVWAALQLYKTRNSWHNCWVPSAVTHRVNTSCMSFSRLLSRCEL